MPEPLKPQHADTVTPIPGAPGFSIKRELVRYKYINDYFDGHKSASEAGPVYYYRLLLDGKPVDDDPKKQTLIDMARQPGARERIKAEMGWR
jgi:hypothetical protein